MEKQPSSDRKDIDQRYKSSIDLLIMPELVLAAETNRARDIALATRSLVTRVVNIDRDTFGVNLQGQLQNYILMLDGRKAQSDIGLTVNNEDFTEELNRSKQEMSDISQLLFWFGTFNKAGKSIAGLSNVFENMATDTLLYPDVFSRVFNLPSISKEFGEVVGSGLGDKIDKVIRACIVVGVCEDKTKMMDLISRPGWVHLFGGDKDLEKKFIGAPSGWSEKRGASSLKDEVQGRGTLVKNGNLWARAETLEESESLKSVLIEIADGDKLAVEIGVGLFKVFGMDSEYGAIQTTNKDGKSVSLLEGWPNSADFAKMMHFKAWQEKQDAAGHPCGPKATRKEIQSLLLPFLKFAGYKTDPNNDESMRSLYELMWGYNQEGHQAKEEGLKLGEIDWRKLTPDVFNDWGVRIVVPGGDNGLFGLLKAEKTDSDKMMEDGFWEFLQLNLNVVVSKGLICRGEYRKNKVSDADVDALKKSIFETFWRGVKSLPGFDVWRSQMIDKNKHKTSILGANLPVTKLEFIKEVAARSKFDLK